MVHIYVKYQFQIEIAAVYKSEILSHFLQTGAITRTTANKIAESLYANDYKKLQSAIWGNIWINQLASSMWWS